MTVQEAISNLRAYAKGYAGNILGMCALAADLLESNVPRWISVEERLPEDCKHVLVFMRRNFVVGWSIDYCHIDTDWLDDGNWSKNPAGGYYNITHWMHLPEPPKEEHK